MKIVKCVFFLDTKYYVNILCSTLIVFEMMGIYLKWIAWYNTPNLIHLQTALDIFVFN